MWCRILFLSVLSVAVIGLPKTELSIKYLTDAEMHNHPNVERISLRRDSEEIRPKFWNDMAQSLLADRIAAKQNTNIAKNVILFLGDGMSVPTLAASRIYQGQLNGETGEEGELSFDRFPYSGFSRTYCVDSQVADSACSATAYLSGIKNNIGTIGVTANVSRFDCEASTLDENKVTSIARWSQLAGKRTGFATTTTVTHASPADFRRIATQHIRASEKCARVISLKNMDEAVLIEKVRNYECLFTVNSKNYRNECMRQEAWEDIGREMNSTGLYASVANRDWESDGDASGVDTQLCHDIAYQLIYGETGSNFNVILGGGRAKFFGSESVDSSGNRGHRVDQENLIEGFLSTKKDSKAQYVSDRSGLLGTSEDTDYLLGLFASSHVPYHLDAVEELDPTLAEMTEAAIKVLSKGEEGYFLFIEGGRIDHAHHDTFGKISLDETVEFSKAIQKAVDMVDLEETLIVVTSDHAHTMSFSGYPDRGNDILGFAGSGSDRFPYTTITYANGPGYHVEEEGHRYDLSNDNFVDKNYRFPAAAPLSSETHGGDDVGIFAIGPWSHLFSGSIEQHVIPHMMAYASQVGEGLKTTGGAQGRQEGIIAVMLPLIVYLLNKHVL